MRGAGLIKPALAELRRDMPYIVSGQDMTDWGGIAPCQMGKRLRQERGVCTDKLLRREW